MEEESREMPDGLFEQTGACRFCGQIKVMHTAEEWSQERLDEEATLTCSCGAAKTYAYRKEAYDNAMRTIEKLFSKENRLKWLYKVELDPNLKPLMVETIRQMEAGSIDSASFQTGMVDLKLTMRADGRIRVKWNYKDKGEADQ